MTPLDNIRPGPKRGAAAAYTGVRPTDEDVDDHHAYSRTMSADDVSLSSTVHQQQWTNDVPVEVHPSAPNSETGKGSVKSTVYFSAILLTSIIPLIGMATWLIIVKVRQGGSIFTGFTSAKIGGHLTQTKAKAIDFVCSALLAPLLMAGLNFIWFACARVCVVNELDATHRGSRGVPLQSLARASRTSYGSYDLLGLWELFSAKTWRLSVLGAVALLSAISSSALSNIIAYESFSEQGPSTGNYTLRMLSDSSIRSDGYGGPAGYNFDTTQGNLAAYNMSAMLYRLPFENATLDSEGAYIGPNATQVSLDAVEANVMSLHNVPGYRLSADCNPTTMTKNSIRISYYESEYVKIFMDSNIMPAAASELGVSNTTIPESMYYEWTGNPKDYFYDTGMSFDFLAFGASHFFVNIIHLSGIMQNVIDSSFTSKAMRTMATPWGDLSSVYQNITVPLSGAKGAYRTYSRALQCVLLRQEGLLEYRRRDDQSWFIASSSFQEKRKLVRSFLQDWQVTRFSGRWFPVLADVLWGGAGTVKVCPPGEDPESYINTCYGYKDFTTAVNNFVFASGETTRILYNVAAVDASHDNAEYFYNVTGEVDRQFYRITYVPVLLLVALLGIIISALMVTTLVVATMKTWSWKTFRQVEITRLVVDCIGADLAKGDSTFSRLRRASDDELAEWAGRYCVGYEKFFDAQNMDGYGHPSVRLRHTTGGDMEKSGSYETVRCVEQSS